MFSLHCLWGLLPMKKFSTIPFSLVFIWTTLRFGSGLLWVLDCFWESHRGIVPGDGVMKFICAELYIIGPIWVRVGGTEVFYQLVSEGSIFKDDWWLVKLNCCHTTLSCRAIRDIRTMCVLNPSLKIAGGSVFLIQVIPAMANTYQTVRTRISTLSITNNCWCDQTLSLVIIT